MHAYKEVIGTVYRFSSGHVFRHFTASTFNKGLFNSCNKNGIVQCLHVSTLLQWYSTLHVHVYVLLFRT